MSDRGDYRSTYCSFWDDADLHGLSDGAYRVLTTLKGTLPAAGIGVVYLSTLGDRCGGKSREQIEAALVELERPKDGSHFGWIMRERNVVWIVNALRYEPTLTDANRKHRTFIRERVLAPLGERSAIVAAFRAYYPEWFIDGDGNPDDRPGNGSPIGGNGSPIGGNTLSKHSPSQSKPSLPSPSLPSPSQPQPASAPAAADARTVDGELDAITPMWLAVWANRAITARWGEQTNPLTPAGATSIAADLIAAKVEPVVARQSIERQVRGYNDERPPRRASYFGPGILEDWEREKVRRLSAQGGVSAPAQDPINAAFDEATRRLKAKEAKGSAHA